MPSSSSVTPPPTSPVVSLPPTAWHAVFARDGARLASIVAGPGGYLASGCLVGDGSACQQAVVASSPDGETWTVPVVDPSADLFAPWLDVANDRFFAIGYGHFGSGGGAMVWTSTDGRAWSQVEAASFEGRAVNDIIESPKATFAVGHEAPIDSDNTSGFLVWPVAADGAFGKPRVIDIGGDQQILSGATWTGREFLAWVSPRWTNGDTTILSSQDGKTWTVLSQVAKPAASYVSEILAVGDRLVAVGYSGSAFPLAPAAWVSDDNGRSWSVASVEGMDARLAALTAEGSGLVARGVAPSMDGADASWSSIDGTAWTRLPDDNDRPSIAGFYASGPASIGGLACVAGTFEGADLPRAAIYCTLRP
jgi:hypothetical protein